MHSGAAQRWQAADTVGVRQARSNTSMEGLAKWWRAHRSVEAARPVQLSAVEARIAALLARADIGVAVTDTRGNLLLTNAALDRFVGFEAGGLTGMSLRSISHAEDAAVDEVLFQELRTGKRDSYCMEKRYIRSDGASVWGRLTMTALLAEDGETLHGVGLIEDVTEQRCARERLEATLQQSSAANLQLQLCLQNAPLACIVWDRDQVVREWNPAAEQMFGYAAAEAVGRTVHELITTPEGTQLIEKVRAGQADRQHQGIVMCNVRKDGTRLHCQWHVTVAEPAQASRDGGATIAFAIDVSARLHDEQERRILEANLRHAQKMQSLGTLAGGIAHDFNNILLAISGNARLAVQELPQEHPAQVSLSEVTRAVARASSIVNQMLLFSRREESAHGPVQLRSIIEEAFSLLRATVPANIVFKTDLEARVPMVVGDAAQLHQVLLNLATNAAYAMRSAGGTLSVQLSRFDADQYDARSVPGLRAGQQYARIVLRDSGTGMCPAVMERIFEPFFTTKPQGQGTGLGLSVVHGIIAAHGGAIRVSSTEGEGSAFFVYLPALKQPAAVVTPAAAPVQRGGGQHVLYLDDEEPLVYLVKRVLQRLGYRVSGFTEPVEALSAFAAAPDSFDAVITDLSMPGLSGTDFAKRVLELRSSVPVIMTSGYVRAEDRSAALEVGVRELVLKPNTVDELGGVLHKLLSPSQPSSEL